MRKLLEQLLSFVPTPLPTGMTEFKEWQDSILRLSKVPDNDSTRFTIAVMVMHLSPNEDMKPKRYFVKSLNKSAANELANFVCLDLKDKQKARIEAERTAKESNTNLQAANESQGPQIS